MKKAITVIFASVLLLMPLPVYASDTQDEENVISLVNEISFDNLQDEILERNPTVKTLTKGVLSFINSFDLKQRNLYNSMNESGLIVQVGNLNTLRQTAQTNRDALPPGDPGIAIKDAEIANYDSQIGSINVQLDVIADLKFNNDISKSQNIQKLAVTSDLMKDVQVWSAQNYFLAYNNLLINQDNLQSSRVLAQKNLNITQIRKDIGMATSLDVKAAESQLVDLDHNAKVLADNLSSLRGELNLLFGQDYNTPLKINSIPELDGKKVGSMDYDADLQKALNNNLTLMLAEIARGMKQTALDQASGSIAIDLAQTELDTEDIKLESENKKFYKAFDTAFIDVKDAKNDLQREQNKVSDVKQQYDILNLKHSLGIISRVEYDAGSANYQSQLNKLITAQYSLLKAYQAYDWMIKGFDTVSSSSGSSSADSSAAGQM